MRVKAKVQLLVEIDVESAWDDGITVVLALAKTAPSRDAFKRNVNLALPPTGMKPKALPSPIKRQLWLIPVKQVEDQE